MNNNNREAERALRMVYIAEFGVRPRARTEALDVTSHGRPPPMQMIMCQPSALSNTSRTRFRAAALRPWLDFLPLPGTGVFVMRI